MASTSAVENTTIEDLFSKARKAQSEGQADRALALYAEVLALRPDVAEAHFQMARLHVEAMQDEAALRHATRAIALRPDEPAIWQLWAQCVALSADADLEKDFMAAVKKSRLPADLRIALGDRFRKGTGAQVVPPAPIAREMRGLIKLMQTGKFAEAAKGAAALTRKAPKFVPALNLQATALTRMGQRDAALALYRRAVSLDPSDATLLFNLGDALAEAGKPEDAIRLFRGAVAMAPNYEPALLQLAIGLNRRGDHAIARRYAEKLCRLDRRNAAGLVALGNALTRLQDFAAAEEVLRRAAAADPKRAEPEAMLAQALSRLDRDEEALEHYDRALAIDPDLPLAVSGKAGVLLTLGQFDEAEKLFRRAFELEPANGETYRMFMAAHRAEAGDPVLDEMIERFEDPATPAIERSNFGFAISKALEDLKEYDRVFPYLKAANDLAREAQPYDISLRQREVAALQEAMADFDWSLPPIEGAEDYAPIFVTGMPRSGTTLVEQIIASHSEVEGAGEVNVAVTLASSLVFRKDGVRPVADIPLAEIAAVGRDYAKALRAKLPGASRITDKSIQTYIMLGLLKRALPKARFVVVRRDPRDNLLSIYKNKFSGGTHLYSNSLRDLGLYYRGFAGMIDFWREVLPEGSFHEIQYEELVSDPEPQARALISACGLEWQDDCLNFHQNTRKVNTLSVYQVRQPISRASLKSWERYAPHLEEMFEALGDLLPPDTPRS